MCIICEGKSLENLEELQVCENVSIIPELPQSLTLLICWNCPLLTTLPELPQSLKELGCERCSFTIFPKLPQSLTNLCIWNCPLLTTLPELPQSLRVFYFYTCPLLTTLPELPQLLTYVNCEGCTSLIFIPESAVKYMSPGLYLKWRKEQTLKWFSSTTGIVYEELIRKTWHPSRIIDWCWDTEEVKWFKTLK